MEASIEMALPVGDCGRQESTRWCAVTGGRGFMGRHLVAALLRSGEWCVRITDLSPTASLEQAEQEGLLGAALRDGIAVYASADVCNLAQLTKVFEGVDTVFHMASPDPLKNNFQLHHKVNVEGTQNVIDACTACKVKRLIYTSSSSVVFGGVQGLFDVDESTPYPDKFPDAYTQTKAAAEKQVMHTNDINGLRTCCICPGTIFGPGDTNLPRSIYSGRMMYIIGDGNNCDDFAYVENVVHGHICAEKALSTKEGAKISGGQTYFITNMEPMNMWDFFYMFSEELGYKRNFKMRIPMYVLMPITCAIDWSCKNILSPFGMSPPQKLTPMVIKYMTMNRTFSCNKATEQLGYRPVISLEEGVKITAQYYKSI